MQFEFTDLISGYVSNFSEQKKTFTLTTSDGRAFEVALTDTTFARLMRNLDEPYQDATGNMYSLLAQDGRMVFAFGIFYPQSNGEYAFEAKQIDFPEKAQGKFRFEEQNWWANQAKSICNFFIRAQFPDGDINYDNYRTSVTLGGKSEKNSFRQETDTISRMIYGMASAFMLTGEDIYLEVAEKGVEYLKKHMRFYDVDENVVYWYHGIDVDQNGMEKKIFTSEFGDDYDAIPMYEQIYALAGPIQTYRANGDPKILKDAELTIDLFDRFFKDTKGEGYYSHIDPVTLSPNSASLGANRMKKNWNSVGDHAPAYLINLYLATGEEKYKKFLEYTFDTITKHFPDYENSPFVNERFMDDWSHDLTWGWQQNRAVVGHNLKIAWNLMRFQSICPKDSYVEFAKHIAEVHCIPKAAVQIHNPQPPAPAG